MSDVQAPYACDSCKSRKIACSRERTGCQRCKGKSLVCNYSRFGVIHRNRRKRKLEDAIANQSNFPSPNSDHRRPEITGDGVQSHLATDIATTRERLNGRAESSNNPLNALSSLSDACAAIWHDEAEFEGDGGGYFLFQDQAASWVEYFVAALDRSRPASTPAPPDVLEYLRQGRPHLVRERAWLVIYYSIVLTMIQSTDSANQSTKEKLRRNLWLALNDARLFLEPSEANIHALTLVACHGEEFTTPSLCWMLATTACRMLQSLGIDDRSLDPQTRDRRLMMFWHLNLLDKGLALIFGRPPTFHKAMVRAVGLPTLDQLLRYQAPIASTGVPGLFGAHYFHQRLLLTRIMTDVWDRLHEDATPEYQRIKSTNEDLELWFHSARQLLEAASLTEKPFLNARGTASIDLRLHSLSSYYHYLRILLTRSCSQMKMQCITSSKQMLHLLEHMISDFEDLHVGIVWQLLCSPFTPFLELFGEIVSNSESELHERLDYLAAMEQLPKYLCKMKSRDSLAAKLESIALVFVRHVRSLVSSPDGDTNETTLEGNVQDIMQPDLWSSNNNMLHWDAFFNHALTKPVIGLPESSEPEIQSFDLETWTSDFFEDVVFDWIGIESQN